MIEAWGEDVNQEKFIKAIEFGSKQAYKIVKEIMNSKQQEKQEIGTKSEASDEITSDSITKELEKIENKFHEAAYSKLYETFTDYTHDKRSRDEAISQIRNSVINSMLKNENKQEINITS